MAQSRKIRRFGRDTSGASALEFALVAVPFVTLLLGVMETSYDLYVQSALDTAVAEAARQVQVGSVIGTSGEDSATFAAAAVCPNLPAGLSCNNLVVGVAPIPSGSDYYGSPNVLTFANASSTRGAVCTGMAGQMVILTAWYAGPTIVGNIIPTFATTYNGNIVHLTSSSTGFVNEYFTGGQSKGVGCG
jgi:Flp pilus assembly protein TadG